MIYPNAMKKECLICGKRITYPFPLCKEHFEEYGDKPEQWDEWLREMWNSKQRRRRDVIRANEKEMSIEYFEEEFPYLA